MELHPLPTHLQRTTPSPPVAEGRGGGPRRRHRRHPAGFTLIELLVVLVILGLLAGLAVPRAIRYLGGAKSDAAALQIDSLGAALDLYRLDVGQYPTTADGLNALVAAPSGSPAWAGPYTKSAEVPRDPWGKPYIYIAPGEHGEFDLYSLGADGAQGGEGEDQDVTSW